MTETEGRRIYEDMGAVPVINALGNRTMLGGSSPSPTVRQAMEAANRYYVDMDDLMISTGAIVAELLGCEAALVTPGCASALVLGTAACMTGDDPQLMERLPDATGMKSEILIQKAQRYKYDRVVRIPGTSVVEFGSDSGAAADELEAAIDAGTLAVLYPAIDGPAGLLSLEDTLRVAHAHRIPVIVDAAYRVYPLEGLRQYTAMGADLVGYGAKYFGAPNSSGLLCGREDLITAARLHSFASFEKNELAGIGRPNKIDRQEVIAVVVALREWLEMDHDARREEASRRGRKLRQALTGTPHIDLAPADENASVANLSVTVDVDAVGMDGVGVAEQLRKGNPSIWTHAEGATVWFSMFTLFDGDEDVIAARLSAVLGGSVS